MIVVVVNTNAYWRLGPGPDPHPDLHQLGLGYYGAYGYSFFWRNDYCHADGVCGACVVLLDLFLCLYGVITVY